VSIDYRKFFALGEGFKRGAFRAHALGDIPDPLDLVRAEVRPNEPLRFHHDEGTRIYDYIGTTWGPGVELVSDRFISVLRGGGFTGWTT
jgi:hypothetical protein